MTTIAKGLESKIHDQDSFPEGFVSKKLFAEVLQGLGSRIDADILWNKLLDTLGKQYTVDIHTEGGDIVTLVKLSDHGLTKAEIGVGVLRLTFGSTLVFRRGESATISFAVVPGDTVVFTVFSPSGKKWVFRVAYKTLEGVKFLDWLKSLVDGSADFLEFSVGLLSGGVL